MPFQPSSAPWERARELWVFRSMSGRPPFSRECGGSFAEYLGARQEPIRKLRRRSEIPRAYARLREHAPRTRWLSWFPATGLWAQTGVSPATGGGSSARELCCTPKLCSLRGVNGNMLYRKRAASGYLLLYGAATRSQARSAWRRPPGSRPCFLLQASRPTPEPAESKRSRNTARACGRC